MSVEDHALEQALARGAALHVGQYRVDLNTELWWWSPQTYRMHGFEPGEVVPTTDLVLAHKHPEDRDRARQTLELAREAGGPFSSMDRIMDARGNERCLVVVGQGRRDRETGAVIGLVGYFVDVTRTVADHAQQRARRDISAAADSRGAIEQAKGVIIAAFGVSPDEAFELLKRTSNNRNVRLRDLACLIVEEGVLGDCAERVDALLRG